MTIAIDFDGTIVEHRYPEIGKEIPFAVTTLKKLIEEKHKLILWTVREGKLLDEAVEWCRQRGIEFYAINKDYPEEEKEYNKVLSSERIKIEHTNRTIKILVLAQKLWDDYLVLDISNSFKKKYSSSG